MTPKQYQQTRGYTGLFGMVIVAIALCMSSGCAVLTVDVDVYKGPLVNDDHIQIQQAVELATGAKPMLIELRDRMEWPERPFDGLCERCTGKSHLCRKRAKPEISRWYRDDGYVSPWHKPVKGTDGRIRYVSRSRFRNDSAARINQILGLYEDIGDKRLLMYEHEAEKLLSAHRDAWDRFEPDKNAYAGKDIELRKQLEKITGKHKSLAQAYVMLLRWDEGGYRSSDSVVNKVLASDNPTTQPVTTMPVSASQPVATKSGASANERFAILAFHKKIVEHANQLFPGPDPKRLKLQKALIKRVRTIGSSFLEARDALAHMVELGLRVIEYVNGPEYKESAVSRESLTEAIAELVALIIHPKDLVAALYNKNKKAVSAATEKLRTELYERLCSRGLNVTNVKKWNREGLQKADNVIAEMIVSNPVEMSGTLLRVHHFYRSAGGYTAECMTKWKDKVATTPKRGFWKYYERPGRRRYGLARVMNDNERLLTIESLEKKVGAISVGAGSLARGRLPEGIETLKKRYLKAVKRSPLKDSEEVQKNRQVLMDALARFAQKVLFIANNDGLLKGQRHLGLFPAIGRASVAALFEDEPDNYSYVRVLQAVGNSILVQIDALRQKSEHEKKLQGRAAAELYAINHALADPRHPDPMKQVGLTKSLIRNNGKATAKDTLDAMIGLLRHEYIQEVRRSGSGDGSERSKRLESAIRIALDQRANMVFLRPASAYLRTSFPATSLQRDAALGWHNMLGHHALRQIPFAEFFLPQNRRLKTIQGIDKQFWQNINRVRVAGAGDTNYVLAKDDIGNWYIKNYSTDMTDVINSAKKLATFQVSAAMDALGDVGDGVANSGAAARQAAGKPVHVRQFENARNKYHAEMKKILAEAVPMLKTKTQSSHNWFDPDSQGYLSR
ncbi:MAG: hypothetical protein QGH60_11450 [Phycisphaerae bacterium]|nr:hypothetical protein [Phycisphaerae bacterium]